MLIPVVHDLRAADCTLEGLCVTHRPVVSKEVLRQRADDDRNWVEAYARKVPV